MKEEEKKPEKKIRYVIGEVATQTAPVIVDQKEENKTYSVEEAIAKIMNDLNDLKGLL